MPIIHLLSAKLGFGVGTLIGVILGYFIGHHYRNNYRKDIQDAHAEAMDALEHVMWKILENQDKSQRELEDLILRELQNRDINGDNAA